VYRRWLDPIEELQRMQEWMGRVVSDIEQTTAGRLLPTRAGEVTTETVAPSRDIQDIEDKILVTADIPGVEKGDITINVRGDLLEITAEKKKVTEEKGEGYIRKERGYTKFYLSLIHI